jgi:hypothetical protein
MGRQSALWALLVAVAMLAAPATDAQEIALDHPLRCGPLVCYPHAAQPDRFYYLPAEPRVAQRADGSPEFSFLTYQDESAREGRDGLTQSGGGGIVHFLVSLETSEGELKEALRALREDRKGAVLDGAVPLREGTFALVSTVAAPRDPGDEPSATPRLAHSVVGTGRAPLLPGHRAAVSLHLTREGASVLRSSFATATSDVSVVFQLTHGGLHDAVDARLVVDWDKVREQTDREIGLRFGYGPIKLDFSYQDFWEQARQTGAVQVEYKGQPQALAALVERAYVRLQELLFEPVPLAEYPQEQVDAAGLADALTGQGAGQRSAPWYLSLKGGYRLRKASRSGRYVLDFRERLADTASVVLAGNLGPLYTQWGQDPRVFRTASLQDPAFRVREVFFSLDGLRSEEHARFLSSVSVTLRKRHGSGRETVREVLFRKGDLEKGDAKKAAYSWDAEASEAEFQAYSYSVDWSFLSGARWKEEERPSTAMAHSLLPPFEFREVEFRASPEKLREARVRMVAVTIWYDFFGRRRRERLELVPETGVLSLVRSFPVPPEGGALEVQMAWLFEDGRRALSATATTESSTVFCDQVPPPS